MNYDIIVIVGILLLIGVGVGAYFLTKGSGYIDDGRHGPLGHPATPFVRPQEVGISPGQKCALNANGTCQYVCDGQNGNPPPYTCTQGCSPTTPVCGDTPYNPLQYPTTYKTCRTFGQNCVVQCDPWSDDPSDCYSMSQWAAWGSPNICPPYTFCGFN